MNSAAAPRHEAATMAIESVIIDPPARRWEQWLSPRTAGGTWKLSERSRRFREQLGLPTESPIVMTGHQAEFWHPGILAKYLAANAAAKKHGARPAAVVVDQDTNQFEQVRYPVRTAHSAPGEAAAVAARTWLWHAAPSGGASEALPTASVPPRLPKPLPESGRPETFAARSVASGLHAIHARLSEHADHPSAARQVAAAIGDLLEPMIGRWPVVFATAMARTDLFRSVVERMAADPAACIRAYNAAVSRHRTARMTALVADDVQYVYELPLWRIDPGKGGGRGRVYAEDLSEIPVEQLAPRAALMTGLLRIAACELFIAGTGGGGEHGYERVAEEWLGEWLGETLVPETVVSATVTLDFDVAPIDPAEAARLRWLAHRALSDPAILGDELAAHEKMEYVQHIAEMKQRGENPAPQFRRMHNLLARVRETNAARLEELTTAADDAAARLRANDVLADRTWPFALYDRGTLEQLQRRIESEFE